MKIKVVILFSIVSSLHTDAQLPYSQDFESTTFPPSGWQLFSGGPGANWVRNTAISGFGSGTACASFDNFSTAAGSYYGIRLPAMNFSTVQNPYVRFQVAYAMRPAASSDVFAWYWSNNGTSNWQLLHNYAGAALTSASPTTSQFVPTSTEWRTITLSLLSLKGQAYVRLAIEDDCANGNTIYFDNVTVFDSSSTGVQNIDAGNSLNIYPDPFTSFLVINNSFGQNIIRAELFGITGSLLLTVKKNKDELNINDLADLPSGIYFIRIFLSRGDMVNKKLMKL